MSGPPDIYSAVAEIAAQLNAINAKLDRLLGLREAPNVAPLLALLHAINGDAPFTASDAWSDSLDPALPEAAALRRALLDAVGREHPETAVRRLGIKLTRAKGITVNGLRLEKLAESARDGAQYRIVRV